MAASEYVKTCPHPVGFVTRQGGRAAKPIPINCGSWTCPHCGVVKKARVCSRVAAGFSPEIMGGRRARMITLTQVLGTTRPIMKSWANFRAILAKNGIKLQYFWTKEFTQKGERHLHVIVNAYIPFQNLRFYWWLATGGESYITWITGKEDESPDGDITSPAGYATKYLTKSFADGSEYKKKERRFGFSQNPLFRVPTYYPTVFDYLESVSLPGLWKGAVLTTGGLPLRYIGYWSFDEMRAAGRRNLKPPHNYDDDMKYTGKSPALLRYEAFLRDIDQHSAWERSRGLWQS